MMAPVLQTQRLELRPHRLADFDAYADFFASDRARYMGGPLDSRAAWGLFCKDVAQWSLLGHGGWAIEIKDSGQLAGQIILSNHPYFPELELGWLMFPETEGKSIAFEAATAVWDWTHTTLKPPSLVSYIHRDNVRSQALAIRLGAAVDADAVPAPFEHHLTFRHQIPEAL